MKASQTLYILTTLRYRQGVDELLQELEDELSPEVLRELGFCGAHAVLAHLGLFPLRAPGGHLQVEVLGVGMFVDHLAAALTVVAKRADVGAVVVMDEHGTNRPQDVVALVRRLQSGEEGLVLGERDNSDTTFLERARLGVCRAAFWALTGRRLPLRRFSAMSPEALERVTVDPGLWAAPVATLIKAGVGVGRLRFRERLPNRRREVGLSAALAAFPEDVGLRSRLWFLFGSLGVCVYPLLEDMWFPQTLWLFCIVIAIQLAELGRIETRSPSVLPFLWVAVALVVAVWSNMYETVVPLWMIAAPILLIFAMDPTPVRKRPVPSADALASHVVSRMVAPSS